LGFFSASLIAVAVMRDRSGLVALGVVGLLASASQTSILAIGVFLAFHISVRAYARVGALGALLTASGATLGIYSGALMAGIDLLNPGSYLQVDATLTGRTDIWRIVLNTDIGVLGLTDRDFTFLVETTSGVGSAHNLWIETWARSGVVGFATLSVAYLCLVIRAARHRNVRAVGTILFFSVLSSTEGVLLAMPYILLLGGVFACAEVEWSRRRIPPGQPDTIGSATSSGRRLAESL
jgi:O-antigen ligase